MKKVNEKNKVAAIAGVVLACIVMAVVFSQKTKNSGDTTDNSAQQISTSEAQTKCMLMEEADIINLENVPLSDSVVKKAEEHCLSLWNTPEKEEEFRKAIQTDWELQKGNKINEYTLEELYREATK